MKKFVMHMCIFFILCVHKKKDALMFLKEKRNNKKDFNEMLNTSVPNIYKMTKRLSNY